MPFNEFPKIASQGRGTASGNQAAGFKGGVVPGLAINCRAARETDSILHCEPEGRGLANPEMSAELEERKSSPQIVVNKP